MITKEGAILMAEITTTVDDLMKLVREKKKLSVGDAAKILHMPEKTVQSWVDFLVDEHILGIEYKFTTPYIYVHSEDRLKAVQKEDKHYTLKDFKEVFIKFAREKRMPEEKLETLWKEHLQYTLQTQRRYFVEECARRSVENAEALFEDYVEGVIDGA